MTPETEVLTLRQLAKESDRHFTTLKRYAERGEIPFVPDTQDSNPLTGAMYPREAALAFVAGIRKNKSKEPREEEELTEVQKAVEKIKENAVVVATQAAINFMRHELELAETEGRRDMEAALHREIAEMLESNPETIQ